ncbi:hypothetical protein [Wolbachia endosymbiont (group A) of Limnophora tigrina]|uniref:hypothetical protein n=1 Tax=Wolbachia endosymbiont (group A) of Limnophora tigrina TaxID=3139318 RepID=UPI0035B50324
MVNNVHTTVYVYCHSPVFFLDSSIGFMVDTNKRKAPGNERKMILITCWSKKSSVVLHHGKYYT